MRKMMVVAMALGILSGMVVAAPSPAKSKSKPKAVRRQYPLPKNFDRKKLDKLFFAIGEVESGNIDNPTVGDNGRSHGRYQIQYGYWYDSGVPGKHSQVYQKAYAERVMIGYWARYCPKALETMNFEVLARTHNGGGGGMKNPKTIAYWKKVKSHL